MRLTDLWFQNPVKPPFKAYRSSKYIGSGALSLTVVAVTAYSKESYDQGSDSTFFTISEVDGEEVSQESICGEESKDWERIEPVRVRK